MAIVLACGCGGSDAPTPARPPPDSLSAFTTLDSSDWFVAPGPTLVTLGAGSATWWDHGVPITADLWRFPERESAQWSPDGKLYLGLGALDLATRKWTELEPLKSWGLSPRPYGPGVHFVWFPGTENVAIEVLSIRKGPIATRVETSIVAAADGRMRGHIYDSGTHEMMTTRDRLALARYDEVRILDLDAHVIAAVKVRADKIRAGADMFAALSALSYTGRAVLIRPTDGAIVATLDEPLLRDAVPIENGLVSVTLDGTISISCIDGLDLRKVVSRPTGRRPQRVFVVGDRIVYRGSDLGPLGIATFANPCREPPFTGR